MFRKSLAPVLAVTSAAFLAACEMTPPTPMEGIATGAAIGAIVADDLVEGAIVGGIVGAAATSLLGQTSDGQCRYREVATGREYIAAC
jgi:hypothetical protein